MKKNYYTFALIFILFLIFYSNNSSGITNFQEDQSVEITAIPSENSPPIIMQEADPLVITDDESLATYAVRGIGTENDPFIIEGFQITTILQHGIDI